MLQNRMPMSWSKRTWNGRCVKNYAKFITSIVFMICRYLVQLWHNYISWPPKVCEIFISNLAHILCEFCNFRKMQNTVQMCRKVYYCTKFRESKLFKTLIELFNIFSRLDSLLGVSHGLVPYSDSEVPYKLHHGVTTP